MLLHCHNFTSFFSPKKPVIINQAKISRCSKWPPARPLPPEVMLKAFSVKEQLIGEFPLNTAASEEPGQGELIFEHQVSERSKTVLGGGTRSRTHRHGGAGGGGTKTTPNKDTHTQIYRHTHT